MTRIPLAFLLFLSAGSASLARADEVSGTRGEVVERSHQLDVVLFPGHARLTVRRTVENHGPRHDQALLHLDVPEDVVATGLRTLGMAGGQPRWFPGVLMEAEAAARKYRELTGIGGYYPKDPALLSWRHRGELMLQVFPVPPAEQKTVEYTLTAPTEYVAGRHVLRLPRLGIPEVAPAVTVRAATASDRLAVAGRPFPSGGAVDWSWIEDREDGDKTDGIELALARDHAPVLDGRVAEKEIGAGRILLRYQIEAAARVSKVPDEAQIVIILDGSRSLDETERRANVAAAGAYLEHFDRADVQVLTFARTVKPAFEKFLPRAQARGALEALAIAPANGSELEQALVEADRLLVRRPPGARRVLLLTDLRTRSSLAPARVKAALARSGAVLHIGVVGEGTPSLEVRDGDPWAPVARATGGLVWTASASWADDDQKGMHAVFEEWARPVRLHRFRVSGPPLGAEEELPETLSEGSAVSYLRLVKAAVPAVEARGELWARPVRVSLRPDPGETRVWSALVFGTTLTEEMSEPEMMVLARHGRAVSPVTSYLAIEPGVRPSTEGLEEGDTTGWGRGAGRMGGLRRHVAYAPERYDHLAFLRAAARKAWRECDGSGAIDVTIETTVAEVADVTVRGPRTEAATCLREALWDLELPEPFRYQWKEWFVQL